MWVEFEIIKNFLKPRQTLKHFATSQFQSLIAPKSGYSPHFKPLRSKSFIIPKRKIIPGILTTH